MKICLAQIKSIAGSFQSNIEKHKQAAAQAVDNAAAAVFFPELSLSGYEPKLARELAASENDQRFSVFQSISDDKDIVLGVGVPIRRGEGVLIGMMVFQPHSPRVIYCKQDLHSDEFPYFVSGNQDMILDIKGYRVALAICYESLLPEHSARAKRNGASIYLASVAKSARGVEKAFSHYPLTARQHSIAILMVNCLGQCDDFLGAGRSAAWNRQGSLVEHLDEKHEGLLIFDCASEQAERVSLELN